MKIKCQSPPAFATRLWIQKFESFRTSQAVQSRGCHFRVKAKLVLLTLASSGEKSAAAGPGPTTPIRHVVVIYDGNISFDPYFGTYPRAANGPREVPFHAAPGTPTVNGLSGVLLSRDPNSTNPFRLDRAAAVTCDAYSAEQKAYHGGLVNRFVQATTTRRGSARG
jgi:phospholipase C